MVSGKTRMVLCPCKPGMPRWGHNEQIELMQHTPKKLEMNEGKVELVLAWVVARNRMCLSYLMLYKFLWKFPCLLRCLSMWSTTSITCTMCTLCMWCMVPWRNAAFSTDEKFLPYLDLLKFRNVGKRLESKPNPVNSMILWSLRSRLNGLNVFKSVQSRLPPRRMEHRASAWDVRVSEFCDEGDAVCGDATFATFYAQTCHSATGALFWATTCDLLPGQYNCWSSTWSAWSHAHRRGRETKM